MTPLLQIFFLSRSWPPPFPKNPLISFLLLLREAMNHPKRRREKWGDGVEEEEEDAAIGISLSLSLFAESLLGNNYRDQSELETEEGRRRRFTNVRFLTAVLTSPMCTSTCMILCRGSCSLVTEPPPPPPSVPL